MEDKSKRARIGFIVGALIGYVITVYDPYGVFLYANWAQMLGAIGGPAILGALFVGGWKGFSTMFSRK